MAGQLFGKTRLVCLHGHGGLENCPHLDARLVSAGAERESAMNARFVM
jgi:hypothetical protein